MWSPTDWDDDVRRDVRVVVTRLPARGKSVQVDIRLTLG